MTKHNLGGHLSWLLNRGTASVSGFERSTRPSEDATSSGNDGDGHGLNAPIDTNIADNVESTRPANGNSNSHVPDTEVLGHGAPQPSNVDMARLALDTQSTTTKPRLQESTKKTLSETLRTPRGSKREGSSDALNKSKSHSRSSCLLACHCSYYIPHRSV